MPVMVAHVMRHCSLPVLLPQVVEPDDQPAERNVPGFPLGHNHRLGCVSVWQDRHSELWQNHQVSPLAFEKIEADKRYDESRRQIRSHMHSIKQGKYLRLQLLWLLHQWAVYVEFSSVLRGIGYLYVHIRNTGIWNVSRLNKPIPTFWRKPVNPFDVMPFYDLVYGV